MYKALFNFDGKEKDRTLSFMTGDEFNLIEQVNEHWWKMQSSVGDIGLVPASYLAINKVRHLALVFHKQTMAKCFVLLPT